jgi:anthranilate/para-aminobenzoate synthase component I
VRGQVGLVDRLQDALQCRLRLDGTTGEDGLAHRVGGGIVADSTPEMEYEETWHKARGVLRALHE